MLSNSAVSRLRTMVREQGAETLQKTLSDSKALTAAGFDPADVQEVLKRPGTARNLLKRLFLEELKSPAGSTAAAQRASQLGGQARPSASTSAVAARTWTGADSALDHLSNNLDTNRLVEASMLLRRRSLERYNQIDFSPEAEAERERNRAIAMACYGLMA